MEPIAMLTTENVRGRVYDYFVRDVAEGRNFSHGDDLFADGTIDSLKIVGVIEFVESQFGIRLNEDDFDISNFSSVDAVTALVVKNASSTT
jgi:acyl carrier protein